MRGFLIGLAALVSFRAALLAAQEHPEHPKDKEPASQAMTPDSLAAAITGYIQQDAKIKGGYFLVYDLAYKKPLALELEKVHTDRLASLGNGVYFVCADMKSADGPVYDLDFYMKSTEHGLEATRVDIHKKSGSSRDDWKEQNGVWQKAIKHRIP